VSATLRVATRADAPRLAALHAARIAEGFLPTLGTDFLERLYRRITTSPRAFAIVAAEGDHVVGYVAAATDVPALYREFLVRDGAVAALRALPRLARSWRRVLETLRYPATESNGGGELPTAEILAVAVAAGASGHGLGGSLVAAATAELARRGVTTAKVVAGAANEPALRLYRGCGFAPRRTISVHAGTPSEVLVWQAS
jgi:ribosomal protein S18 acetylase RimI-like enzyme